MPARQSQHLTYTPARHSKDEEALLGGSSSLCLGGHSQNPYGMSGYSYTASDFAAPAMSRNGSPSVTLTEDSFYDDATIYASEAHNNRELNKKFMVIKKERKAVTPLGKIVIMIFAVLGLGYGYLYMSGKLDSPGSVFSANYGEAWKEIMGKLQTKEEVKSGEVKLIEEEEEQEVKKEKTMKKEEKKGAVRAFLHKHVPSVEEKADELAKEYPRVTKVVEYSGTWCALYNAFYCLFHTCKSWCGSNTGSEESQVAWYTSCCHCCIFDLFAAPCSAERRQKLVQFMCEWPVHVTCDGFRFLIRIPMCLWPSCLTPKCCEGEVKAE